ncbi:uncharacterized protein NESG_01012 [Nematocida ausubeli]|uniref:DHHA2 domain-containing protein n=1 Tax=Nematocida ausubeli (strain ATCC PRA-371 / ERTm2) TaxID=1913371 RepID=A0A086J3Y8_NEMA1|nr:uncharacterized protein NESG_01012 [Nematocida ausubeli]KAI5135183.1 exopolyphosphatase [Nematocida ausubeli]KAI5147786.1 exopolyphosphatase [Nematocida ausubeli]KFG26856.1 hypothetical protein NESG_01012 [Nematocida ausubeli]
METYKEIIKTTKLRELFDKSYAHLESSSIEIVLGNPSCDQDSFIGSHILAVMLGRVPVVNLSKEIFKCKQDLVKICDIMGVSVDELVFLVKNNDAWVLKRGDKEYPVSKINIKAFLIDFNLPDQDLLLSDAFTVDHIIDHHALLEFNSKVHSQLTGMNIQLHAGSCCSIIYRYIRHVCSKTLEEKTGSPDYKFLLLMSIPIMTDTNCLQKRTHDIDREGVDISLGISDVLFETAKTVMEELKTLKKCEPSVPTNMIVQMDYKSFDFPKQYGKKTFGISSVKYAYDEWVARDGAEKWKQSIKEFVEMKKHEFYIINCKVHNKREFYIYNPPSTDFIEKGIYEGKPVNKRAVLNDNEITVYTVDTAISRKIIAPMLFKYLEQHK